VPIHLLLNTTALEQGQNSSNVACVATPCMPESVSQMHRSDLWRSRLVSMARVVLAFGLLTAFLSGIVPLASVSAGSICQLECCAGRAPHASGSCMNGSCQANLKVRPHNHSPKQDQVEKLCGLPQRTWTKNFGRSRVDASSTGLSDRVAIAFEKPCQTDCGGCASGFTNSTRQRNSAVIAGGNRLPPPADIRLSDFRYRCSSLLKAQSRHGAPRGPPISLS
jgi:hypothetical protein